MLNLIPPDVKIKPKMRSPLYICGTTASGKTSLALQLAQLCDGEIINADAYQIYAGLEILSACPSAQELAQAPHHLYRHLALQTEMNAQLYRQLALPVIAEVQSRGKLPIITGGSGMYLKFLTHGPSPIPASDPVLRASLEARPLDDLLSELEACDPEVLLTFPRENKRYVVRALEIFRQTGQKSSALKTDWETLPSPPPRGVLLTPSKEETLAAIEVRSRLMLDQGAIEEVRALPPHAEIPTAAKAIGIREITAYLEGTLTRAECEERLTISTRQYAKRQRNWFNRETWLTPHHPSDAIAPLIEALTLHDIFYPQISVE